MHDGLKTTKPGLKHKGTDLYIDSFHVDLTPQLLHGFGADLTTAQNCQSSEPSIWRTAMQAYGSTPRDHPLARPTAYRFA